MNKNKRPKIQLSSIGIFAVSFLCLNFSFLKNQTTKEKTNLLNRNKAFEPLVGEIVFLSSESLEEARKLHQNVTTKSYGYITATPPNGKCFIITTNPNIPDERICQKQVINFKINDLDPNGNINWRVTIEGSNESADISWPTPYRFGAVVPIGKPWPGETETIVLKSCTADKISLKITLTLLSDEQWFISFPEKHEPLVQPPDPPNLVVYDAAGRGGFFKPENEQEAATKKFIESLQTKEHYMWLTHPRNAYSMTGSRIKTSATPEGSHGKCRYNKRYLECFETLFHHVYLDLSCLKDIF